MHVTAIAPGALVPAELCAELGSVLQTPSLARLLQRAAKTSEFTCPLGLADATWIAREVYGVSPPAQTAPYAWAALTGARSERLQVWHADPVHIAIGRDSLIVQSLADAAPDEDESAALLSTANECLRLGGCTLRRAGSQWFAHVDIVWEMAPPPLSAVLDQPMPVASPSGADALRWSRLHNEIQMRWHDHPVNQAREAQGRPAVNALWLHGGGIWGPCPALRWRRLHTERVDLRGLADAAGAIIDGSDERVTDDTLVVCDEPADPAREGDWSRWLLAMQTVDRRLAALPSSATLELVLTGQRHVRMWSARPSDRYRLWRHTVLAQALAE